MKKKEEHIISLLRIKDKKGMCLLYDNYGGPLYGVILRILKDDQLAKDALQETFIKVWKNFERYDETKAKLFTWMYRIARNTALDHNRYLDKNRSFEIQNAEIGVSHSTMMNIDTLDLVPKMNALPEKYREVLHALFFQGYSQREWSKESGLPLGTIKTRLRIGIRELRKVYDKGILVLLIILIIGL